MERALKATLQNGRFDNVSEVRSRAMSAVRGRGNKTTEVAFRMALVRAGVSGWRLHAKNLPGRPDFVFERERMIVFVDGCFWHGCPRCGHTPKVNKGYWVEKLKRNKTRDRRNTKELRAAGYAVTRLWECQLEGAVEKYAARIGRRLRAVKP